MGTALGGSGHCAAFNQLNELDNGHRTELDPVQPVELMPLVASLNHYVVHQEALRTSHRQALDDFGPQFENTAVRAGLGR